MKALFAGSFDPFHLGHLDIVQRSVGLFQELHIVVGVSEEKSPLIPVPDRIRLIREMTQHLPSVIVNQHSGLIVQYAKNHGITCLIRGLRIISDFDYEQSMDWHNHLLAPKLETLFLMTRPELRFISSRGIKEILRHHGDISSLVPKPVENYLKEFLKRRQP